jgi:hypothetical protein
LFVSLETKTAGLITPVMEMISVKMISTSVVVLIMNVKLLLPVETLISVTI